MNVTGNIDRRELFFFKKKEYKKKLIENIVQIDR
jgi:hypothetical protein